MRGVGALGLRASGFRGLGAQGFTVFCGILEARRKGGHVNGTAPQDALTTSLI